MAGMSLLEYDKHCHQEPSLMGWEQIDEASPWVVEQELNAFTKTGFASRNLGQSPNCKAKEDRKSSVAR